MKMRPLVCFEHPEAAGGPPAAPDPNAAAVPAPPAPAAPVAPPQPPAGAGPWAADLAAMFPDESVRTQVDTFLRSKVQPHVTQIETDYAPARQFYQDLQDPSNSAVTYILAAQQLYGDEVASKVAEALGIEADEQGTEPTGPPQQSALTPEQQELLEWAEAQRAEQLYQSELSRIKAIDPSVDEELFLPFVISAEGRFDDALPAYQAWVAKGSPQTPAAEPTPPPTTLGDAGAAAAAPPVVDKMTMDQALDSVLDDMRAARSAPTTVGSA